MAEFKTNSNHPLLNINNMPWHDVQTHLDSAETLLLLLYNDNLREKKYKR